MTIQLWAVLSVSVLAFIGVAVLDSRLQRAIRLIDENSLNTQDVVNANAAALIELQGDQDLLAEAYHDLCGEMDLLAAQVDVIADRFRKTAPVRRKKIPTSR